MSNEAKKGDEVRRTIGPSIDEASGWHVDLGWRSGTDLEGLAQAQRAAPAGAAAPSGQANILVIFGDDIGQTNVSAYSLA